MENAVENKEVDIEISEDETPDGMTISWQFNDGLTEQAKSIDTMIDQVYSVFGDSYRMKEAVNFLRMQAWTTYERIEGTYDNRFLQTEENLKAKNTLDEVQATLKILRVNMHKGKIFGEDEKIVEVSEKFRKVTTLLYKCRKAARKKDRPISWSFLTPGTKVERNIYGVDKDGKKTFTVESISPSSCGHVLITCKEKKMAFPREGEFFPRGEKHVFNSAHVIRVVSHKPGRVVITDRERDLAKDVFDSKPGKSKNSYCTYQYELLIRLLVEEHANVRDINNSVNLHALKLDVAEDLKNSFRWVAEDGEWHRRMVISKKKIRKAVLRNFNRSLETVSKQLQNEDEYQRSLYDDFYGDDDED